MQTTPCGLASLLAPSQTSLSGSKRSRSAFDAESKIDAIALVSPKRDARSAVYYTLNAVEKYMDWYLKDYVPSETMQATVLCASKKMVLRVLDVLGETFWTFWKDFDLTIWMCVHIAAKVHLVNALPLLLLCEYELDNTPPAWAIQREKDILVAIDWNIPMD